MVLESRPLGPFDVADVLLGALDARLTRFRFVDAATFDGGPVVMLRIGGFGAVAGGILWFASLAASNLISGAETLWMWLGSLGTFGLLLAVTGLSAFQAHREPRLAWAAFAIPGIGTFASMLGLARMAIGPGDDPIFFGSIDAWTVWLVGLLGTLVGSIIFAVASIRAGVLSRRAAIALAVSSVVVLALAFGTWGIDTETLAAQLVFAFALGSFAASWVILGAAALRRGPIRPIVQA